VPLHLDLGVVDRRVEQAALARLRSQVGDEVEARRCDLEILARPVGRELIRHDQDRAVEALLRPPVAGEFLLHAGLTPLALVDQVGDEQVRQHGRDG